MCPVILRLAIDTERVTRQLFEPLALQLVHLFSLPAKVPLVLMWATAVIDVVFHMQDERPETTVMLDAISDGMADVDASLRGFSARLVLVTVAVVLSV